MSNEGSEELMKGVLEKLAKIEAKLEVIQNTNELGLKPYLSIKELAGYIGVPLSTVYKLSCRNFLPKYRVGKRVMFKREEVERYIQKTRIASESDVRTRALNSLLKGRDDV